MPSCKKRNLLFGALTIDERELIAEELNIPMSDVYGGHFLYSQFALVPKGKYIIQRMWARLVTSGTSTRSPENSLMSRVSRRNNTGPAFYPGSHALSWLLRPCPGHHDQRSCWPFGPDDVPGILAKYKE